MSDTTQLKALRDEAKQAVATATTQTVAYLCDRAIASLAAEQRKPCAEQAQQPAQAGSPAVPCVPAAFGDEGTQPRPQPAPADVPVLPSAEEVAMQPTGTTFCQMADLHAACVRIAQEREEALFREQRERNGGKIARISGFEAARQRDEARSERDEALRELETSQAELAALKGQEPVCFMRRSLDGKELGEASEAYMENGLWGPSFPVYAAPVATIPLAQHESALAQARREERGRCAVVADDNGAIHTARAIRALADGGEVGK